MKDDWTRVEDFRHLVNIDVPIKHTTTVYHIVINTLGIIGYVRSYVTPDGGCYDTLAVDLGSLPAIIKELGPVVIGDNWNEEEMEIIDAKDPYREGAVTPPSVNKD